MKVGSLFSGVGGFELGTSMVFPQADIIWQCEMDKFCRTILHKHWPTAIIYDDVRTIDTNTLPDIDLLLCGFPCQDLSIANNTKQTGNINGHKSGLWWEAHRIIGAKRPKYIMLENVPAITYRNKGGMAVLKSLASLGYDAWWDCIRASDMGAPHTRERWFLIAIATDTNSEREQEHTVRTIAMETQQQPECGGSEDVRPYTTDYWKEGTTESPLCSVDDGIPNRVARLKAMGNAIVPQCAAFVAHQLKLLIQETT